MSRTWKLTIEKKSDALLRLFNQSTDLTDRQTNIIVGRGSGTQLEVAQIKGDNLARKGLITQAVECKVTLPLLTSWHSAVRAINQKTILQTKSNVKWS